MLEVMVSLAVPVDYPATILAVSTLVVALTGLYVAVKTNRDVRTGNSLKAGEGIDQILDNQITAIPPTERTDAQNEHHEMLEEKKSTSS